MVQPLPAEASAPAAQEHLAAIAPGSQQRRLEGGRRGLSAVAGVDVNVLGGEITGPDARVAVSSME